MNDKRYKAIGASLALALLACAALLVMGFFELKGAKEELGASQWNYSRLQSQMVTINGQIAFLQDQVKGMKGALKQAGLVLLIEGDARFYHDPNCIKLDNSSSYPYRILTVQQAVGLGYKPDPDCH